MRYALLAAALVAPAFAQYETVPPPAPEKPLVSVESLIKDINIEDLLAGSRQLQKFADENGGNRAFGGAGHNATTEWIYQTLLETGAYHVYKQPFVELFTAATVEVQVDGAPVAAEYLTYGPSANVNGTLVKVNSLGCNAADFPSAVSGQIAVISRGECTFAIKATNAKAAGAIGAAIYNNVPLQSLSGTLGGEGSYAPVVGLTQEVGNDLLAKMSNSTVQASLSIDAIRENRTNYNVIAETKEGDHDNVLMIGGHSDSVFAGPGINDDGSGTIGSLTVGLALAKYKLNNAVRLGFWGAEEFGKLGSFHYLKTLNGTLAGNTTQVSKLRAYLNFDMIASPNYVLGIYDGDGNAFNFSGPAGSATIEHDFESFYAARGFPFVPALFSLRSDYAAFLENGIPAGGLFTGAEALKTDEEARLFGGDPGVPLDPCYHRECDDLANLAHDAFLLNVQSIANSVARYALAWEGIPRVDDARRRARSVGLVGVHGGHGEQSGAACGFGGNFA